MAETMRHRFAIDLDEIERQLRQPAGAAPAAPAPAAPQAPKNDALAELARIVGQDDPFRALLDQEREREERRAAAPRFAEALRAPAQVPVGVDENLYAPEAGERGGTVVPLRAATQGNELAYALRGPVLTPEEEGLLGRAAEPAQPYAAYEPESDAAPGMPPQPEPARSRKGLITVGAVLGLAIVGVAGALGYKAMRPPEMAAGEVPIVRAEAGPTKVQPQNPGGAEIPNQDRRIYDRAAPEGQTRVVSRDEQPIDVREAARAVAPQGPAAVSPAAMQALGEPRKVRTVTIKPEAAAPAPTPTAPVLPVAAAPAQPAAPVAPVAMALPAPTTTASTPAPTRRVEIPAAAAQRPVPAPAVPVRPEPPVSVASPAPSTPAAAPPAPTPVRPRVAAVAPAAPAPEAAPQGGGFAVQLAVRTSDKDAQAAVQQIQSRYAGELGGRSPIVRKAEVNGSTVYRVRVAPLSREDASALCNRLKGAGAPCWVGNN